MSGKTSTHDIEAESTSGLDRECTKIAKKGGTYESPTSDYTDEDYPWHVQVLGEGPGLANWPRPSMATGPLASWVWGPGGLSFTFSPLQTRLRSRVHTMRRISPGAGSQRVPAKTRRSCRNGQPLGFLSWSGRRGAKTRDHRLTDR
jgi:hypothetical protein